MWSLGVFFFFQAEDGIRDLTVTGVQTCALPICGQSRKQTGLDGWLRDGGCAVSPAARDVVQRSLAVAGSGRDRRAAVCRLGGVRLSTCAARVHPMTDPMAARLGGFDATELRREFLSQGAFVILPHFLPPELTAQLVAAVAAVGRSVNRNYLPGHKQGGSVSRHAIDELAPVDRKSVV